MTAKPKTINLAYGERVIAVVPEACAGPGWTNTPTWVYIKGADHTLRCECIQPDERTPALQALFRVGLAITEGLRDAVPTKNGRRVAP